MVSGQIESCEVILRSQRSGRETRGQVQIQSWNRPERVRRALKFGALCWGLALVAVLIPIVHFFLVPTLLVSGPIMAWLTLRQTNVILGGEGPCPDCASKMVITRSPLKWPLRDLCTMCKTFVTIEQNFGSKTL